MKVMQFAEINLTLMSEQQNRRLNNGLPLTPSQKKRAEQIKESDKKRANAALAKEEKMIRSVVANAIVQSPTKPGKKKPGKSNSDPPTQSPPRVPTPPAQPDKAAGALSQPTQKPSFPWTPTASPWAEPFADWQGKGFCLAVLSCT